MNDPNRRRGGRHVQTRQQYLEQRQRQMQQYRYENTLTEEERAARRNGRAEARRLRQRAERIKTMRRILPLLLAAVVLFAGTGAVLLVRGLWQNLTAGNKPEKPPAEQTSQPADGSPEETEPSDAPPVTAAPRISFRVTPDTVILPDETINSGFAILVDLDEGTILAQRDAWNIIHPASMTKILTVLVAAEHITNLDASATVTQETIDYCREHDCSIAGFLAEEEVSIMDLFYGTILPSGADAALTLAEYTAGSHQAFVDLMNEKAEELGISATAHFANCVGLYDEKNVCTVYDMAVILKAAMDNDFCRQILGERIHDIPPTELHPEGVSLSNWFIRRIEDHMPSGVVVKGAKTGFISQSGNCSASLAQDGAGHSCLCVTAMAGSVWQCIFDHVALYADYGYGIPATDPSAAADPPAETGTE